MTKEKRCTEIIALYVTPEMKEILQMYSLVKDVTVSQVERDISQEWIDGNKLTREKLVVGIVGRMKADWDLRKLKEQANPTGKVENKLQFKARWLKILTTKLDAGKADEILKEYAKDNE